MKIRLAHGVRSVSAPILALAIMSCASAVEPETVRQSKSGLIFAPTDDRVRYPFTQALSAPLDAVGQLPGCTGTLIAPNKVLTAYHCVGEQPASNFSFTPHASSIPISVSRVMHGRECCGAPADFAILTLSSSVTGRSIMKRGDEPNLLPFPVNDAGYSGDLNGQLGVHYNCLLRSFSYDPGDQAYIRTDCDYVPGASGGPVYDTSTGVALVYAVNSGATPGDSTPVPYSDGVANLVSPGRYFVHAPDNALGIAASALPTGTTEVFATDADWPLVAGREKRYDFDAPNGEWRPWDAMDDAFGSARKLAATNVQDGRQALYVVTSGGALRESKRAQLFEGFGAWSRVTTPTTLKDIAATGGNRQTTELYALGTNNVLYAARKTGGADSNFSSWCNLGTVSGAQSLTALRIGSARQIFVASSTQAIRTTSSTGTTCSAWTAITSFSGSNSRAVAAGYLQDGRAHVLAVATDGTVRQRVRATGTGGTWGSWFDFAVPNPANSAGFTAITSFQDQNGLEQLFAIANGEVFFTWQVGAAIFNGNWQRFYL